MNTLNRTLIRKHLRTALKHSARAVTLGTWLMAGAALAAPPANDDFANAIDLTGTGSGQTGDAVNGTKAGTNNVEATLQTGVPNKPEQEAANTVWFKWTCPADGDLTLTTLGSPRTVPAC